jgi:ATP-dependent helicase/nuclease subunit B
MPNVANRLPKSLSASAVNALRECPYRFFTQAVLRLREREEFDTEPGQRDYGSWLHATLQRFHDTRTSPLPPALEVDRLQQVAELTVDALGLDRAALLPFRAGLADFARRYIAWLHQRDGEGWHYRAGEQALESLPPPLQGTGLHGRIDRIDAGRDKAVQLIDYKTSSPVRLKQRLREPLEDAQLAFYAALISDRLEVDQTLSAGYLALDDRAAVELFSPTQVQADAQQLIQGLSRDLQHMRAGAPLRALGAPPVCDWCEVRGLCRRDHWAPNERASAELS